VIRILTFGAIVELAEGVTGLLHISQISSEKIRKVEDVLRVNDVVNVRILEVLKDERKIKLSMKDVGITDLSVFACRIALSCS
jgi:4-hydroxy-3-methylbut-2-enyl diphosphate reductase